MATATFVANFSGSVRTETRNGKSYLVAPAVLLKQGTFQGSAGRVRYTAQSLRNSAEAWNGIPVTLHHPTDRQGLPVSASEANPDQILGFLDNVEFSNRRLRGEVYLDMQKLNELSLQSVAETVRNGQMDVSTGLFPMDTRPGDSTCDVECHSMTPDHLALLPGPSGQGACSWGDGCGLPRANQKGVENMANYTRGVGGSWIYNGPPRQEQLEEGIHDPLGAPAPDTDEHGNELGIGDPFSMGKDQEPVQRSQRSRYLPDDPPGPLPSKVKDEEGLPLPSDKQN